ncbi:helix-turn-helix transcriptional regulator [Streptomyces sp. NPDC093252]|uniref:helix-turn-helix domain-containing protein n=1 Tax=Streptomyces sp. NPDC093252 TaxID=3154980 RepID=UPI0034412B85
MRTFGAVHQALREHAGLSREEFAELVQFSKHTVASVEQGRRLPDPDYVERAEEALGNTGALRNALEHVTRQPGLAAWFRQWARLEKAAITLYVYDCRVVPGLLQTEAYARQLFAEELPYLTDEQIEEGWAARAKRQELLRGSPGTAFSFLLEEHTLRRHTGGTDASRGLIDHLLKIVELRNVEVQIMSAAKPSHAGMHGPMQLLETTKNKWFAYTEAPETGQLISDRKIVSVLQKRYARMRSQALSLEDSVSLLHQMRGAL